MIIKKGAMFGLDARIALAIFGALSVISGAALYSAIQQSRVVSAVTTLEEVGKAIESYMLDVGSDLPLSSSNYDLEALLVSSAAGWKGPYLSITDNTIGNENLPMKDAVDIRARLWGKTGRYDGAGVSNSVVCSAAQTPCNVYLEINQMNESLARAIDEYVDSSADVKEGRVQLSNIAAGKANLYYKSIVSLAQE
ncbi:MAG TPA: hypothetical protein DCL21_01340 [Alphaproteobacteria bacterium]|nr:hypothetical protein [Alphaproteobacteria bacterium]